MANMNNDSATSNPSPAPAYKMGSSDNSNHHLGKGLANAPGEIIENISMRLDEQSFFAFRAVNKHLMLNSVSAFGQKFCQDLVIDASVPKLEEALALLKYPDIASRTKTIGFTFKYHDSTSNQDLARVRGATIELFEKLTNVTDMRVTVYESSEPHPVVPLIIQALTANPRPKLKNLYLGFGHYTAPSLQSLLTAHANSLDTIHIKDVELDTWNSTFAHIRGHLSLSRSTLLGQFHVSSFDLIEHRRHETAAFRNPDTKQIEHYTLHGTVAQLLGPRAVKLGLNQILQREESELYDSELPRK